MEVGTIVNASSLGIKAVLVDFPKNRIPNMNF